MIEVAFFGVLAIAVLAVSGLVIYTKFFKAIREWPVSTNCRFGDKVTPDHEEPFWSWWKDNSNGMGMSSVIALDTATKRRIDVVCRDMTDWQYKSDPSGTDFEPVDFDQMEGDCEDFARVLAMRLIDIGVHASAMTLGFGAHPRIGWHCVLLLNTSDGCYMSEVGAPDFRPWDSHGFIKDQGGPAYGLMAPKADGFYYDVVAA